MILLIDNYDSFVYNLRRYLLQLGQTVRVLRNDDTELLEDLAKKYAAIIISPGPKSPSEAGHCLEVVKQHSGRLPILGVCLGHQVIFEAFGGTVDRALKPVHGKSSPMHLEPSRLFSEVPNGTPFARYHSLIGTSDSVPQWLNVIARCPDDQVMGIEHREHPTFGIQFHPESVLSSLGHQLLSNFLHSDGLPVTAELPRSDTHGLEDCSGNLAAFPSAERLHSEHSAARKPNSDEVQLPPAVLPGQFQSGI